MTTWGRAAALAVGMLGAVAIAWLSALPVDRTTDTAVIRASWRTAGIAIEECLRMTEEELAEVPAHMRQPERCTGRVADYELVIEVDSRTRVVDTLGSSGIRSDRPIYVFRDLEVPFGSHEVMISFEALLPDDYDVGDEPARFVWAGAMDLGSGEIGLVTMDPMGAALERR